MLNGKSLTINHILKGEYEHDRLTSFEQKTLEFIKAYLSDQTEFSFYTSGSTGNPKEITFQKNQLKKSALRTNSIFGLVSGSTILCCLNTDFVAGKMMLIRALEGDLNLIIQTPSSNPLQDIDEEHFIDFIALTPLQIDRILAESPQKIASIKNILIGGAMLHPLTEEKLQRQKAQIWHSYAMTETLTHVALRHVNGTEKSLAFHALPGVSFNVDARNCLVIKDQVLGIEQLISNDIVELIDEKSFRWIGRYDNVINSGGIKIRFEETENRINEILKEVKINHPICLISLPDDRLGEKLVLLIETKESEFNESDVKNILKEKLPKFHDPKVILSVPKLMLTTNGKIDRIRNKNFYLENKISRYK